MLRQVTGKGGVDIKGMGVMWREVLRNGRGRKRGSEVLRYGAGNGGWC